MTDRPRIRSERERVTCFLCRRRRPPAKMTGTRCTDRDDCLRAMGRHVSSVGPTEAEKAARRMVTAPPWSGRAARRSSPFEGKCSLCGRHGWIVQSLGRWVCWESCNNGPRA